MPVVLLAWAGTTGCGPDLNPDSSCHYLVEDKLEANTETPWGTVAERAERYEGTFLIRPVWDSAADYQPPPGVMDELVVDAQLEDGKVHSLKYQLDQDNSWSTCPEYRFSMVYSLQVRNHDGSFWLVDPEVHVFSRDIPGTTDSVSYELELVRYPDEWEAEVPLRSDQSFVQFTSATLFPTTYEGVLSSPAPKHLAFSIGVVRESEYGVSTGKFMEGWAWDMERL